MSGREALQNSPTPTHTFSFLYTFVPTTHIICSYILMLSQEGQQSTYPQPFHHSNTDPHTNTKTHFCMKMCVMQHYMYQYVPVAALRRQGHLSQIYRRGGGRGTPSYLSLKMAFEDGISDPEGRGGPLSEMRRWRRRRRQLSTPQAVCLNQSETRYGHHADFVFHTLAVMQACM